jgi:hypothetical protein
MARAWGHHGVAARSPEQGLWPLRHMGNCRRGGKERGERGEPILGLTNAHTVVWRPSDGDEAAVAMELGGGGARAQGRGKMRWGGAVSGSGGHLLL